MSCFKTVLISLSCFLNCMCNTPKDTQPIITTTDDKNYSRLSSINYASYEGKTIGYLLDNEKIDYRRFHFVDSEYKCLNFVKFTFGLNVYLEIYCPLHPKYIKMCDAGAPFSWNLYDFRKETISKIVLVRLSPLVKRVTVFDK